MNVTLLLSISVFLLGIFALPSFYLLSFWILYHYVVAGPLVFYLRAIPVFFWWLSDLIVILIFVKYFTTKVIVNKDTNVIYYKPIFYYLLFLVFSFISGLIQNVPIFPLLLQLKDYSISFLLAIGIMSMPLNTGQIKFILKIFLFIMLLQVPVTIIQFFILGNIGDLVSGTFGAYGGSKENLLIMVSLLSILIIYHRLRYRPLNIFLMFLTIIPPFLGRANFGLFLFPLMLFYITVIQLRRIKYYVYVASAFIVISGSLFFLVKPIQGLANLYLQSTIQYLENPIREVTKSGETPSRLASPIVAWKMINEKEDGLLFGYGFGTTKESTFSEFQGVLAEEYAPRKNQIGNTLFETGPFGLLLILFFVISVFKNVRNMKEKAHDFTSTLLTYSMENITVVFIIALSYTIVLKSYFFGTLFWILYALTSKYLQNHEK